jgi:hypothetical protein
VSALVDVAVAVSATVGAAFLLWVGRRVGQIARGVTAARSDLLGEPARPGVAARPGVMERLQSGDLHFQALDERVGRLELAVETISTNVALIRDELPKNGTPVAVKVAQIAKAIEVMTGQPLPEIDPAH